MSEPLLIEKRKTNPKKTIEKIILTTTILTLIIIVVQIGFVAFMSGEAVTTLKDVNEVVPEVKEALKLLENLCNHKPFNKYCTSG